MQVYDKMSEPDFLESWNEAIDAEWSNYDEYVEKYGFKTNPHSWSKRTSVGTILEGVRVLVKRGLIDPHMVDDMISLARDESDYFWHMGQ